MNLGNLSRMGVALALLLGVWSDRVSAHEFDDVCKDTPAGTRCRVDGNKCTTDECDGKGSCVHLPKRSCDDQNVCTNDACDPATGACINRPDPSNDSVCAPGSDLKVEKDARCKCNAGNGDPTDDRSDDRIGGSEGVVFCERDDAERSLDSAESCFIGYTITVKNKSSRGVVGVQVADVLPHAVSFRSSTATQGHYDAESGLWDVGALGSAGMAMLNIVVATASSPDGALVDTVVSRHADDGKSGDDGSHDDASNDDGTSGDHGSSDDPSSDDGDDGKLIRNCADLVAVAPPDTNPINDSDCVIVSLAADKCDGKVPPWVRRNVDRTSRLLTAAARTDSSRRVAKLVRKAGRTIERTSLRIERLGQRGELDPGCVEWLHGEIDGLANEARHLAP